VVYDRARVSLRSAPSRLDFPHLRMQHSVLLNFSLAVQDIQNELA